MTFPAEPSSTNAENRCGKRAVTSAATWSVVLMTAPVASVASDTVSTRSRHVACAGRLGLPGSTVFTCQPFGPWSPNRTDSTTIAALAGSPTYAVAVRR
jgi:hypothetical protein